MRTSVLVFASVCVLGCYACGHTNAGTKAPTISGGPEPVATNTDSAKVSAKVEFATQIKPILDARCQPCHFSGGKVYAKMPFDRAETIKMLGTKLFTRIKDENERRLISTFLAQE
jgi:hypothetical protein